MDVGVGDDNRRDQRRREGQFLFFSFFSSSSSSIRSPRTIPEVSNVLQTNLMFVTFDGLMMISSFYGRSANPTIRLYAQQRVSGFINNQPGKIRIISTFSSCICTNFFTFLFKHTSNTNTLSHWDTDGCDSLPFPSYFPLFALLLTPNGSAFIQVTPTGGRGSI